MVIGGLDIGTTGCKITLYDHDGQLQYRAYRAYPASRSTEQHVVSGEAIWTAVKDVLAEAASKHAAITAIGVTSFGESFVLLDEDDEPIRDILLYTDPHGGEECAALTEALGKEAIQSITGLNPHSCYSLPKLLWIKQNHPADFAKARRVLLMEDYIVYKLTGQAVIDYSLASRTMAFDIRKLEWSDALFDAAGIDKALFSKPVRSGSNAGSVKPTLCDELELQAPPMVVPVGHDQVAAAIGAGVFSAGCAVDGAGTVECVTPVFDDSPDRALLNQGHYALVPYVIPGKYVTYAYSFTGGELLQWFIQTLAKGEKAQAEARGCSVYTLLEESMQDEPTGLLVLPYFAGAATPYMDADAKGVIAGLTLSHTASAMYRAMMEGVAYEMRLNIEKLHEAGVHIEKLHATGGGAASRVWMQIKADILGIPLVTMPSNEAGAAGCAMMAGVAAGVFDTLEHAAASFTVKGETFTPRVAHHTAYSALYERYRRLYAAVRPLV